jgi:hypothetical protein
MERKGYGMYFLVGIIAGVLVVALGGCSVSMSADAFYPSEYEPRKHMPWYGSAGGTSHGQGVKYEHFNKLGG